MLEIVDRTRDNGHDMIRPSSLTFNFDWGEVSHKMRDSYVSGLAFVWNVSHEVARLVLIWLEAMADEQPLVDFQNFGRWVHLILEIDMVRLGEPNYAMFSSDYHAGRESLYGSITYVQLAKCLLTHREKNSR